MKNLFYVLFCMIVFSGCEKEAEYLNGRIVIPSVFTPNGDGLNDIYTPTVVEYYSHFISHYDMKIYDLDAHLIYETGTIENGWPGYNVAGNRFPLGIYLFKIEISFDDGVEDIYTGTFELADFGW